VYKYDWDKNTVLYVSVETLIEPWRRGNKKLVMEEGFVIAGQQMSLYRKRG
jgi:hypothetical protein